MNSVIQQYEQKILHLQKDYDYILNENINYSLQIKKLQKENSEQFVKDNFNIPDLDVNLVEIDSNSKRDSNFQSARH